MASATGMALQQSRNLLSSIRASGPTTRCFGCGGFCRPADMMRLPKFDYRTPRTIAEAVKIIADTGPEAQFVAGGTDLYPNMKRRQQTPRTVISVMRLPELNRITGDGGSGLAIGASVTLTDICEDPIIKR